MQCIPKKPSKKTRKPWKNNVVRKKLEDLKNTANKRNNNPTAKNMNHVKNAKKSLRISLEN